jgi:hypothetical protein
MEIIVVVTYWELGILYMASLWLTTYVYIGKLVKIYLKTQ